MRLIKWKYIIFFGLMILFVSSCSIPSDFYEKYDGIPFEKVDSFDCDNKKYDLLLATETDKSLAYYYKIIDNKSSKETWVVNYSDVCEYISESYLSDELTNEIYNILVKNKNIIEEKIKNNVVLYRHNGNIILEEVLKNNDKIEIGSIIIAEYLPIIISNNNSRYLVFIPINAYICMYKGNIVYNFKNYNEISLEELVEEIKILER